MEWFITFGNRVAGVVFAWLGPLCLLAGVIAIAAGALSLWQSANPRSPWHTRRWAPWLVIMFGAMLLGFSELMNLTGAALGTTGTFGAGSSVQAYQAIPTSQWATMTPSQALIAGLTAFRLFWAAMGATICYRGVLAALGVARGTRRHGWGVPVVLFISGSLVARLDQVAAGIVAVLPNSF